MLFRSLKYWDHAYYRRVNIFIGCVFNIIFIIRLLNSFIELSHRKYREREMMPSEATTELDLIYASSAKLQISGEIFFIFGWSFCFFCAPLIFCQSLYKASQSLSFSPTLQLKNTSKKNKKIFCRFSLKFSSWHVQATLPTLKEFSCLLVGETSQGRGSSEREEALIHLIAISKYC